MYEVKKLSIVDFKALLIVDFKAFKKSFTLAVYVVLNQ